MSISKEPDSRVEASGLDVQEKTRLIRDGVVNYSSFLVSGAVGLVLVPIMLDGLGKEVYGLWVAAMAVVGLASIVDFGLGPSVTQVIAAAPGKASGTEVQFVSSAGTVFLVIGFFGGLAVAALGLPLSEALHLSNPVRVLAPLVFMLAGVFFLFSQLLLYARAVLIGMRRFDAANLLAAAWVILGAAGTIVLLRAGHGLVAVAGWQATSAAVGAVVSLVVVGRLEPNFRFRWAQFDWGVVQNRLPFSLTSQLTNAAIRIVWDSPALLIGLARGSASIVPYHIGQKFPVAASQVGWCAAEALYPAASPEEQEAHMPRMRAILEVGIRWVVVLVLPLAVVLWVVAPTLLEAWIGQPQNEAVQVLRITSAAILADAIGVGAFYVLWGRGAARPVFLVLAGMAATQLGVGLWLLLRMGVVGMAWAMLVSMTLGSVAFLQLATRACRLSLWELTRRVTQGLLLPTTACAGGAVAGHLWLPLDGWAKVVSVSAAGGAAYAASLLCLGGAREEEWILAREVLTLPAAAVRWAYFCARRVGRRIEPLRSAYYFGYAVKDYLRGSPSYVREQFESEFNRQRDPYGYDKEPRERERLERALRMLDTARGETSFQRALEIGCAEGAFTELLAPRCESLLAVDISSVALNRARQRQNWGEKVQFNETDVVKNSLRRGFDLVVAMSVLDSYYRPSAISEVRAKLVDSLLPGGYLLISSVKSAEVYENATWAKSFLRGARWLNGFIAEHPSLRPVATEDGDFYVHTLLQKVQ
jgi:O-antigen/teichoic acid export membrane protein/2-polyprenyl-3-methyl-5-hydroxy-6-metoxy-1,4-benzoquinol methylase